MSDPVFKEVTDCFKGFIESSINNLSPEDMEASRGDIATLIESYAQLLGHHDLTCSAAEKVASCLNNKDRLEEFNATEIFKDELSQLQKSVDNKATKKNPCEELHKLLEAGETSELKVVSEKQTGQLDPFTQKPIEEPAKSTKCNHLFDYITIKRMFSHLKGNKLTLKCPHIGCVAVLKLEDIEQL